MASNAMRLSTGGHIDRSKVVRFRFNGKSYSGYAGDTLASALLANGVQLTARSFKYHRPRGIMGAGVEEPSSLVELLKPEQCANQPITTVQLTDGLEARSVNCWPSPSFDVMAINQLFSRLLPAAFYYKTFMWPTWHLFEPFIRRAAGLAQSPDHAGMGRYETRHAHCDVLVAGAGPAGLMAALTAARSGAHVILADDGVKPGGSLLSRNCKIGGAPAEEWITATVAELESCENVMHLQQATVWAYREHNLLLITEKSPTPDHLAQRTWRVRAGQAIIATGAIERALVFADNDRPGVMLASAAQTYVNRYGVKPGQRAVIFTNNNSAYEAAADLQRAGIELAAIVDSRAEIDDAARAFVPNVELLTGHVVTATNGARALKSVRVGQQAGQPERKVPCDLLCVSGGWNPAVHLYSQSRSTLVYDDTLAAFIPGAPAQDAQCAGASAGLFSLQDALADGTLKGQLAAQRAGYSAAVLPPPDAAPHFRYAIDPLWHVAQQNPSAKAFVDVQNDVTLSDVHLAMREGFDAVEHVKRYTTAGMGIDQGKVGNINVIGAIAQQSGQALGEIGTTTFRSPYVPIEFGAIAGAREGSVILPYRHTPITAWHKAAGAEMYEAGARWRRPGYYPKPGETFQETVNRESLAVRENVAVYDGAPLGKFEIKGRDSLTFLQMLYTNSFDNLAAGTGRYGLMLSDDGTIIDDGVTFKLAENHYLMTTSTGHADAVNQHMEQFLQIERPEWDVRLTTVTTQWSNATVCGPKAREVMHALGCDLDLSNEAFPFMAMREGTVAGIPARVCRVSFTGELSYEINVWSRFALKLWERIIEAGKPLGIIPIGSEANHVLRVEKGFLSLGHEADGTTDPYDLGMGWIMSRKKDDFIGKRSVALRRSSGKPRRELVGLLIDEPERLVTEGAPITPEGKREASEGLVTACVWSVLHNRAVGLALLTDGRNRIGQKAHIRMKGDIVTAEITKPCFHDADGLRLRS